MWACASCSLENEAGRRRCVLCNARQPPDVPVPTISVQPRRSNTPKKVAVTTTRIKEHPSDTAEVMVATTEESRAVNVGGTDATILNGRPSPKMSRGRISSPRVSTTEERLNAASKDSAPLADVHCFVDVHLEGGQKASSALSSHLEALGATVRTRFMTKVTHIIYQGGNAERAARSRTEGVNVVTPSWVEACRSQLARVPEAGFQADVNRAQKRPARTLEPTADLQFLSPTDALFSSSQRCDEEPRHAVKRRRVDLRIDELLSSEGDRTTFNEEENTQERSSVSLSGFEAAERAMLVKAIRAVNARSKKPLQLCLDDEPMAEVTHLVVHESERRTLRVVGALLHGAFVLKTSFVYTALDSGWPKEEEHEFRKWAPSKEVRCKVLRGHRVFIDMNESSPPREMLVRAAILAGGDIASDISNATLFVSSSSDKATKRKKVQCLKPGAFFDVIEEGTALDV